MISSKSPLTETSLTPDVAIVNLSAAELVVVVEDLMLDFLETDDPKKSQSQADVTGFGKNHFEF